MISTSPFEPAAPRSCSPAPVSYRPMQAMMWPMLKLLGMPCMATYHLCSDQMDRKLTAGESFCLRLHLMMCGVCKLLPAQFRRLRELVRRVCEHDHEPEKASREHLPPEIRARMVQYLKGHPRSDF